jgi:hypothetical protein
MIPVLSLPAFLVSTLIAVVIGAAGTAAVVSSGGGQNDHAGVRLGTLDGVLAVCCDLHGSTREAGTVVVKPPGGEARVIAVGSTGQFSVALPAGSYKAVGGIARLGWRIGQCRPIPLTSVAPRTTWESVVADRTTRVVIVCQGH